MGRTGGVMGCGPIGLFAIRGLRIMGGRDVIAVDVSEDWWQAILSIVPDVLHKAAHPEIEAIAVVTSASPVVVCDRAGQALAPAILWMDARAAAEAGVTAVDHPVTVASGGSDAVEWLVPGAMWLFRHDLRTRAAVVCEALDYVCFRPTGRWAGSLAPATCAWNHDGRNRRSCPDLYALFGVPDLADRLSSTFLGIGAVIGPLAPGLADRRACGEPPLPCKRGTDARMGAFGVVTVAPGSMRLIGGTSNVHITQVSDDGSRTTAQGSKASGGPARTR